MFEEESISADTKDFIKVSDELDLSDYLGHTYWTIWISYYLMNSVLSGRQAIFQIALRGAFLVWQLKMALDSAKHSLANSCLQRNGSATVAVRCQ